MLLLHMIMMLHVVASVRVGRQPSEGNKSLERGCGGCGDGEVASVLQRSASFLLCWHTLRDFAPPFVVKR